MSKRIYVEKRNHDASVAGLEQAWDQLLEESVRPTIFASFDYVQTSIRHLNRGEQIFYLLMRAEKNDGRLLAVFPLCIRPRKEHGVSLRVVMHALPPQTTEVDKPCPVIHKDHEADCWMAFADFMKSEFKAWDIIDLEELVAGSFFPEHVKDLFSLSSALPRVKKGPDSPIVDLSVSWEDFWSHHRKLRKKCGRLERRIEHLRHEITNDSKDIIRCLENYIEVEKISWKEGEMVAYHREFYADLLPRLAEKGRVWFSTLYDGEVLVSVEMAYTYLNQVYFCHGTYAPDYAVHSPGMVNSCWFIRHFTGHAYAEGDYLAGFASYVDPWAYRQEHTREVVVYRTGWKLGALFLFHAARKAKFFIKKMRKK
ncbi:GNAT family N-acetyltransferase [Pontiella agarivorans]|uniref:GNAT family N-acetyltransferase n=1 Tax=Pontiella agarivorans TaxID=3038953 RepID=A0ABU5MXK8_9BACT|nr:GNAT family N-acetyltransferase [Pontiella agarivorans]MDZ8118706.1 GNAT family N-acetyltransferase [Pontiella agarivorans]